MLGMLVLLLFTSVFGIHVGFFVQTGDIAVVEKQVKPKPSKPKQKSIRPAAIPLRPPVEEDTRVKVTLGGVVDEPFTEEMTALRDLIESLGAKVAEMDGGKRPVPATLETALMGIEERIRAAKATERKHLYQQLSGVFPEHSPFAKGNIKERLKKMYTQWLPKKHETNAKKVT